MRTDDLIGLLASGAGAVESGAVARRFALALGWGLLGAALLMAIFLGVRHDLGRVVFAPMFWIKLFWAGGLAWAALLLTARLARPAGTPGGAPRVLVLAVLAMWGLAAVTLWQSDAARRPALFFGSTWSTCPLLIAMLSLPVLVAVLWALRGLAPTRPRAAGAAAGLLAGAAGATVYCLHCPELAAPFLGFWYLLGMLLPALAGVLLGPRLLRW